MMSFIAILTTAKKECHQLVLSQAPARRKLIGMNFAVLGLGIIGSAWARNLIADGHAVRCWNRTPRDFPNFYPSIQDAVEEAEAIFVIVADPPAVESVLDQIASHLGPDKIVVQSSTISARWTLQFADQVRRTGASFLEAPFTGSKSAAEDRQTVYYLAVTPSWSKECDQSSSRSQVPFCTSVRWAPHPLSSSR